MRNVDIRNTSKNVLWLYESNVKCHFACQFFQDMSGGSWESIKGNRHVADTLVPTGKNFILIL